MSETRTSSAPSSSNSSRLVIVKPLRSKFVAVCEISRCPIETEAPDAGAIYMVPACGPPIRMLAYVPVAMQTVSPALALTLAFVMAVGVETVVVHAPAETALSASTAVARATTRMTGRIADPFRISQFFRS
ncbi:hypothetical protein VSS74_05080 [Conexibacter stalactiti]|uniref:Uncharacterized protein n=1 Tax=Conexibacter stalactiti TaxID=1940611 RepID=A0ABU4HK60_9ACTN|nr:hypothetical protein [Conexibacter stalactiti]MDW5593698.1 hypothetical protein [Conexibacter stalactiti]MEC5034339.1 hypothetical protein [Conexibacter stalactiti]